MFRDPTPRTGATVPANAGTAERFLNATQRRVLSAALCEPSLLAGELRVPPSNAEVAARIHRGVETVRTGMGALYKAFQIAGEDGAAKRMRLVETAVRVGAADLSALED
ncbi:MAG: hypothetical protein U0Y82_06190 [Thermoleophilia bacterium]